MNTHGSTQSSRLDALLKAKELLGSCESHQLIALAEWILTDSAPRPRALHYLNHSAPEDAPLVTAIPPESSPTEEHFFGEKVITVEPMLPNTVIRVGRLRLMRMAGHPGMLVWWTLSDSDSFMCWTWKDLRRLNEPIVLELWGFSPEESREDT